MSDRADTALVDGIPVRGVCQRILQQTFNVGTTVGLGRVGPKRRLRERLVRPHLTSRQRVGHFPKIACAALISVTGCKDRVTRRGKSIGERFRLLCAPSEAMTEKNERHAAVL